MASWLRLYQAPSSFRPQAIVGVAIGLATVFTRQLERHFFERSLQPATAQPVDVVKRLGVRRSVLPAQLAIAGEKELFDVVAVGGLVVIVVCPGIPANDGIHFEQTDQKDRAGTAARSARHHPSGGFHS